MLSGWRHVAWARIPAQDVLFSVVEEERAGLWEDPEPAAHSEGSWGVRVLGIGVG